MRRGVLRRVELAEQLRLEDVVCDWQRDEGAVAGGPEEGAQGGGGADGGEFEGAADDAHFGFFLWVIRGGGG